MKSIIIRILGSLYGHSRSFYYLRRYEFYRKKYSVDKSFEFNGTDIRLYGDGRIQLGSNSYMGSFSTMQSSKDYKICIGSNCQISHNVRMYTSSTDPNQDFTKEKIKPPIQGNILIGNGVWIGANVFINPGVTIGDNVVIGANAVVTKNLEANAIYGGVPAKLIRRKN